MEDGIRFLDSREDGVVVVSLQTERCVSFQFPQYVGAIL